VLLGNHESHLSIVTIDLAKEHWVTLLTFPLHRSHKLQPLDVTVYFSIQGLLWCISMFPVESAPRSSSVSLRYSWKCQYCSPTSSDSIQSFDCSVFVVFSPVESLMPVTVACGLRHELSLLAWMLGSWVRIPLSVLGSDLVAGWSLVRGVLPNVLD
jgi:hypothetical protein